MDEKIKWNESSFAIRKAVAELIGWCTKKGELTKTGKRIAGSDWQGLTPAARNILINHGITAE